MLKKYSGIRKNIRASKISIAIIRSRFNEEITQALFEGALAGLKEAGVPDASIRSFEVPGAFEIPLAAWAVAQSKKFEGVICLGAVIQGETPHFDYVCQGVTQGILRAQLQTKIPMAFGVLTTHTIGQALKRARKNDQNKGYEAAKVILEMIEFMRKI